METSYLLSDEKVAEFITRGYLVLENDLPPSFHQSILDKISKVYAEEGNPGNNILPRLPEINKCFETPIVKGALTSILGENYYMHPHRHCHYNRPGQAVAQGWHKDGYWSSMRSHRPWWAIIFYYTQDITEEMGPTEIMPGSQYYEKFPGNHAEASLPFGKAGTMVLVHFDLWHRASLNRTNIDRYMLKFQFIRLEAPAYPTWNHTNPELIVPENARSLPEQRAIWNDVWNWMLGKRPSSSSMTDTATHVDECRKALQETAEPEALHAAYTLGGMGAEGISALLQVLEHGEAEAAKRAAYGLTAAGEIAVPGLIRVLQSDQELRAGYAAFTLGMIGHAAQLAVPSLVDALEHQSPWVIRNAVEALGMIRQPAREVVPALIKALGLKEEESAQDVSGQKYIKHKIRYTAALSLLRVGQLQESRSAVSALRNALEDEDRYVQAYACEALTYIKSDEAVQTLIHFFRKSRWCPFTGKGSSF